MWVLILFGSEYRFVMTDSNSANSGSAHALRLSQTIGIGENRAGDILSDCFERMATPKGTSASFAKVF